MKFSLFVPNSKLERLSHEAVYAFIIAVFAEGLFHGLVEPKYVAASVGRMVALFCSLYVIGVLSAGFDSSPRVLRAWKDTLALTLITIVFLVVGWSGTIVSVSLADYVAKHMLVEFLSPGALCFIIPYAAGALILQAILGLRFAFVYSLAVGLATIIYDRSALFFGLFVLLSSLAACQSLVRVRSRLIFMRIGVSISLLSVVFVAISLTMESETLPSEATVRLVAGVVGGLLSSLLAVGLLPIVEYFGGFVTNMRLMEMATLDHPLLKDLSIHAPGTWNHSNVMGMMAETAADSVGANAWVARVGAYFHDVGKMKKPLYFVENQQSGENRHDKLSPSMSALIIRSHVKDGLELARKHKLPGIITDMIEQHHGTSPIEYFYDKALKEAQAEGKEVDRSHYCYPGPRPQTREAGILMLADCIEAASRTMVEPTTDRIQGMVQKMINKVFASGQLNECELTLADLHQIAKCFTRVLSGIYHHRISYSEPAEKVRAKSDDAVIEGVSPDGSTVGVEGNERKRPPLEDLRRLGLDD